MDGFWRASAFLTRLPARAQAFQGGPHPLGADAAAFPLVGVAVALPSAVLLVLLGAAGLQPVTASLIALLLLVALTGALHEDGLADTADGLFGHTSAERALEIMKDSRIGTYGALALIGSVLLRVALLTELAARSPALAALALIAAAGASRGAMAWLWSRLPSARRDGLAGRMEAPSRETGRKAAGLALALLVVAGALTGALAKDGGTGLAAFVLPALLGAAGLDAFRRFLLRRLGGTTGDTLGAAQQIVDIALLLGFALAL
ncbi:adenosylcobinamide-GDP ribazoletransferase [Aureimonas ureilytica]|uniref:adenosylcobinamide-GDP ribazoletransferase n=1 Tax=Aureimonas ureilytica TaxID=401562 RepID=UPI0003811D04|nr:adenosylcobinamide-GDP ribazoletransferase [Aureimonas ureilytica]